MILRAAALCAAGMFFFATGAARADQTDICLSSYERAQVVRKEARLRLAREQLLLCSQVGCPKATRADCVPWLAEVERALPSIVVTANDGAGHEIVDVSVSFDGMPLASRLDGRSLLVDPGEHTLRLESAGYQAVETRVVIHEAEKDRAIAVTLLSSAGPKPATPAKPEPIPVAGGPREGGLHPGPLVFVLGGVSLVALGSFTYFGLTGSHDARALRDSCYPHCATSDVASANRELLVADVSLGVALVAAGVATYLLLTGHDPVRSTVAKLTFAF